MNDIERARVKRQGKSAAAIPASFVIDDDFVSPVDQIVRMAILKALQMMMLHGKITPAEHATAVAKVAAP